MEGMETRETGLRTFDSVVREGQREAAALLRRFEVEGAERPQDILDGHNVEHTANVVRRTRDILKALSTVLPDIGEREVELGGLFAAFHDVVQEYELVPETQTIDGVVHPKVSRKRVVEGKIEKGQNEDASLAKLHEFMDRPENREHFTDEERMIAREALDATIPDFNVEELTVEQGTLSDESHIITRAIALSDLGDAGMEGFEAYKKQGDGFFREDNFDITDLLRRGISVTAERRDSYAARMRHWIKMQVPFAQGRKNLFEEEIGTLPDTAKDVLHGLFDKFDETIQEAAARVERAEKLSFEALAADMGYTPSNGFLVQVPVR